MAITNLSEITLNQWLPKRNNLRSAYVGNITFIAASKLTTYGGTTPPSGIQTGDFVLVLGECDTQKPNAPSGFTVLQDAYDNTVGYSASYKYWTSGDSTISVSGMSTDTSVYGIYVFRNVGSVQSGWPLPIYSATGGTTVTFPAITVTSENSMVIRPAFIDDYSVTSLSYPSGWNLAGTFTNNASGATSSGSASVSLGYREFQPATVASQTASFGPASESDGDNYGASFILLPGAG